MSLSCDGIEYGRGTPAIGTVCIGAMDSYTFVKGIYGGYYPMGHQIIQGKMYTTISNILVPLQSPVKDVCLQTTLYIPKN